MSGKLLPVLLLALHLTAGSVRSQGSSQDAFIIQYLERRLAQMEVGDCPLHFCLTSCTCIPQLQYTV